MQGTIYEIREPDLLSHIEQRLQQMEESGEMADINRQMQEDTRKYVHAPPRVKGISRTKTARSWLYDPSITVNEDLKDQDGRVFHKAGTTVNPLDRIKISKALLFIDGADEEQVNWALRQDKKFAGKTKIILIGGAIIELMKKHQHRFYFDQKGKLTEKFGIKHVPALMKQEGNRMRIHEVVL